MTAQVETAVRGPEAYSLARNAIAAMEKAGVWPTPLNFELWIHYLGDPEGPLGIEIKRLLAEDAVISDETSEMLAAEFLPRGRLSEEIRDAGAVLDRELASVSAAIAKAHKTQTDFGETLADASQTMDTAVEDASALKSLVGGLSTATQRVRRETASLEKRLESSNKEVARLREHLEQVRRDAMTDALTNLANRKAFDERLEQACADAGRTPLTLAILDIDHFKRFNDTWGHQTGDQVLRYVSTILSRVCSGNRFVARFGGEEFAIIFPGESPGAVMAALEHIREEVSSRSLRRRSTNDDLGAVTLSAGFAEHLPSEGAAALLERADEALYASKRGGRNRVTSARALENAA
ncbi:MAG: diguanylate cyclase [Phenylobacterium sp.]|jgi:diguanylate cyclase|uniref:diguanylate cyclase n=1 Tax=Brevundimonas mediterranea TaxID=74329 RepID=A0AB37EAH4_9CAUL|nr:MULTISPECIES: GGDEF domain-containing protein [Brevundimonas]MDZ4317750.1 diguanylate cyclase [Phenylobacterium sp.]OYX79352.1 MAG: GGDEF domain-containing protein [Brevundimonas sp. 32-68-21]EDX81445.1 GGDEF domain protein [Brevundimonas sp. BAL3]MBA4332748.1 GGDEF domain-containing protein [Brevundimonas sp.]MDZ4376267.1 diguanylate cyclase [Phenylobacterium sp.]